MKKFIIILYLAAASLPLDAQQLKLLSYNIRHCEGMDGQIDYARTAAVINAASPDVVALQEVDSCTKRSDGRYTLHELSVLTGMTPTFAPAIDFDGGKYGIGMLSRTVPVKVAIHPLPGAEEARTMLVAEFKDYMVCSVHLSLTPADRLKSIGIIASILSENRSKPIFVMGDFNNEQTADFLKLLRRNFRILNDPRQPTYPSDAPTDDIDYIISLKHSGKERLLDNGVIDERMASNHRPVWVTCELKCAKK